MTRGGKVAVLAALGIAALIVTYCLRAVFLPLFVALLLAYVLNPALGALERRRLPRPVSIAGVYLVLLGALGAVVFWAIPTVFAQATGIVRETFLGEHPKVNRLIAQGEPMLVRALGPDRAGEVVHLIDRRVAQVKADLPQLAERALTETVSFLTGGIATLFSIISFLVLVPVYLLFLLKHLNSGWERITRLIPRAVRPRALATLDRIHRANMAFFRGQIAISTLEGLILFLGLSLIGVGYPLLFGALYVVASLVPFLGVVVMFGSVELFVLIETGHLGQEFWLAAGVFGLIQALEALVFQPLILGKETGLHPVVIILSLLSAGQLLGLFGLLLAIPLASSIKILFEDYVRPLLEEVADLTRVRRRPEADPPAPASP